MTNLTTNGSDTLIPGTNLTWAEAGAMHKDHLRDARIERILSKGGNRKAKRASTGNHSDRGFYVLAADGSIDKQATRERRLFGNGGAQVTVVETPDVDVDSNWDGTYSFRPDGRIDKRATRERRIFGEPTTDRWSYLN